MGIVWVIAREVRAVRRSTALSAGLLTGALILSRENALVLALPLTFWFVTRPTAASRRLAAAFALGLVLVLAPVAARNRLVGGEWALTTTQLGPNLFIGNNAHADGTYRPLVPWRGSAVFEQNDAKQLAEHATGRSLTSGQVSAYFRNRALSYISERPFEWANLVGRKAALVLNAVEVPDTEDQYTYARWSWPLRTEPALNFAVLAALALFGAWIARRRMNTVGFLPAVAASYGASLVVFYVMARYRFLLVPAILPFAAVAIVEGLEFLRTAAPVERIGVPALCVFVVALGARPMVPHRQLESITRFNTGVGLEADGRLDEAISEYVAATTLDPTMAVARYNLGLALQRTGRLGDAVPALREAVRLAPDDPRAVNNLGAALGRTGRTAEAAECFRKALRIDPNLVEAHMNLAASYESHGDLAAAAGGLDEAVRIAPLALDAWRSLARVRAKQGRTAAALTAAEQSARLAPDDAAVLNTLGIALAQAGRTADAASAFERALALQPANAAIQRNLARVRELRP